MTERKMSPCLTCTRVLDPEECENKNCMLWRRWFLGQWEQIRNYPRRVRDQAAAEYAGVPLGGRHYCAPHEAQKYLSTDPCKNCLSPRDLCSTPCRVRRDWEKAGKEVGM